MRTRTFLRSAIAAGLILTLAAGPAPRAQAHNADEIADWLDTWAAGISPAGITIADLEAWRDFHDRHPLYFEPAPRPRLTTRPGAEAWRPLVAEYFRAEDVDRAVCLIGYESGGDPSARNPNSTATGLFQILASWEARYGLDRLDPTQNVELAAIIRDVQGWTAWTPYNNGKCR